MEFSLNGICNGENAVTVIVAYYPAIRYTTYYRTSLSANDFERGGNDIGVWKLVKRKRKSINN